MTRQSIFDILKEEYDIARELENIKWLFESELLIFYITDTIHTHRNKTIEQFVSQFIFPQWKARGTCLSCEDMKRRLKLDQRINTNNSDEVIKFLEYYVNIANLFFPNYRKIAKTCEVSPYLLTIEANLKRLLDYLNLKELYIPSEETVLVVPNDPAATAAAEISSRDTALNILKYNHASLKGQIEEKRELLVSIAREYEPLLSNPPDGCSTLFSKTNGLLNCLHIRHNNKEGKWEKNLPDDLECWYDEVYQMLLLCKLESDNVDRQKKVQALLDSMKG